MRIALKLIGQTLKIFILFTLFTIIFYFALNWFNEEYQGLRRYDTPEGDAVKVFNPSNVEDKYVERLLQFYLDGE